MKHMTTPVLSRWTLIALVVLPLTFAACGKTVGETIDDATITARVKTALLNDPQVGGMKIDVDTTEGVVTMSGIVKSQAEADARHPAGEAGLRRQGREVDAPGQHGDSYPTLRPGCACAGCRVRQDFRHLVDERRRPAHEAERRGIVHELLERVAVEPAARAGPVGSAARVTVCRSSMSPASARPRSSSSYANSSGVRAL